MRPRGWACFGENSEWDKLDSVQRGWRERESEYAAGIRCPQLRLGKEDEEAVRADKE